MAACQQGSSRPRREAQLWYSEFAKNITFHQTWCKWSVCTSSPESISKKEAAIFQSAPSWIWRGPRLSLQNTTYVLISAASPLPEESVQNHRRRNKKKKKKKRSYWRRWQYKSSVDTFLLIWCFILSLQHFMAAGRFIWCSSSKVWWQKKKKKVFS